MHAQFKRAKGRLDTPDLQLYMDLNIARSKKDPDPIILRRLLEKLHLRTIDDLKKESVALHEIVISADGDPGDYLEDMSALLKNLKDCLLAEDPEIAASGGGKCLPKHRSPVIPDDFRCPISLELMKDPVIVSTGQVQHKFPLA